MAKDSKIVKEYNIQNQSMLDHIIERCKKDPWWTRLWCSICVYYRIYIRDKYYDTKAYIKNFFRFQKVLREWRPWDYEYQVKLFAFGLEQLADTLEKYGNEVPESRNKKIAAIRELVTLLRTDYEDGVNEKYFTENDYKKPYHVTEYEDESIGFEDKSTEEEQLVWKEKWDKYYEELEREKNKHYNRIFRIIRGQKNTEFSKLCEEAVKELPEDKREDWGELMAIRDRVNDGTGIESWWD